MTTPTPEPKTASVLVDGAEVRYHEAGQDTGGRPVLVMVHGTTGSTASHFGYLFPMLAYRQRVVSVDLAAGPGDGPLTIEGLAAQVEAVIDRVHGDAPIALLGYSLGAVAAAAVAAARPEVVQRLVLVAGWMRTDAHQRLRNRIWRTLRTEGSAALRGYMLFCAFSRDFVAARTTEELADIAGRIGLDAFVDRQMDLNTRIDIAEQVPAIRARTLVVGCTHDLMVPKAHSQQLFGAIEDARYTQIDSGHAVVFERPAELLRAIDTFLERPEAHPAGTIIPPARP